ncbi:Mor transcription activator-like protein [Desulfitobacterium dehalogenans ATCC 51507]|uniref:Mor transcription activator-like protein n=1 Tax=Desulfitobacterium dehalogenans (strain ATCC 51507 / DSM 9161 / JW/IU-DC1) TaxID=756499 RepID=I4AAV2_DESDJ|nr:CD3324 family protein [Desulfitobacterium dehalogenans]AFM01087.1 Mor transcription activator-like protein [Desulfitobacterium dehalogenans ATCC 51507]
MSYIKAADVLPKEIIDLIQKYIDGEYVYIPRKESNRKAWGENTKGKEMILFRNMEIYEKYTEGMPVDHLSETYYLSPKSIQKIIAKFKLENQ